MSAIGTKRTSPIAPLGKAHGRVHCKMSAYDPKRTFAARAIGSDSKTQTAKSPAPRKQTRALQTGNFEECLHYPLPYGFSRRSRARGRVCVFKFVRRESGNNSFQAFAVKIWKRTGVDVRDEGLACFVD